MTSRRAAMRSQALFAAWGVGGVALLFVEAIARLGLRAYRTLLVHDDPRTLAVAAATVALFCYVEGYRGLQRRFAPEAVERALDPRAGARVSGTVLAPLYVLGLVGLERPRLLRAWCGVGAIAVAVVVVRSLPPWWRGIVDAGVSAALAWGLLAILCLAVHKARRIRRHAGSIENGGTT